MPLRPASLVTAVVLVVLALVAGLVPATSGAFQARVANSANTVSTASAFPAPGVLPYRSSFSGTVEDWANYNGCWQRVGNEYRETCGGNGPKSTTLEQRWFDYTMQADVRIDGGEQAGVLVRVTNPSSGTDAFNGYYASINTDGRLSLSRMNGTWTPLQSISLGTVARGAWYHVVVQAIGCTFTVSAVPVVGTAAMQGFTYTDTGCSFTRGGVGLRDHGVDARASWRYVSVTAGGTTSAATVPGPYLAPLSSASPSNGVPSGFTAYGQTPSPWRLDPSTGVLSTVATGSGDKAVQRETRWTNFTLTGELRVDQLGDDAGFLVRTTNPGVGTDVLDGYYIGLNRDAVIAGRMRVGGANNGWRQLGYTLLPTPTQAGAWYQLTIEVVGCRITTTVKPASGGPATTLTVNDTTDCRPSGAIGVRALGTLASYRAIAVTPR